MNCKCFSETKEYICTTAAAEGHIDCLRHAHEHNCPWNEDTCALAAKYGHLNCLRYAHENGCSLDWITIGYAITYEKWLCAIYAIENGCPYNPTKIPASLKKILIHRKAQRLFPVLSEMLRQSGRNKQIFNQIIAKNKN